MKDLYSSFLLLQRQFLFSFIRFHPIYAVCIVDIEFVNQAFHTMESITIARPYLWPQFSKAFEFIVGQTPLSTFKETLLFVVIYYVIIFGGRELMRDRAPFQLSFLFLAHNFCLAVISGILLALYIEAIFPTLIRKGLLFAICDIDGGWTQHLVVLYYVGV